MTHRLLCDMCSELTQPDGVMASLNRYALSLTTVSETIHQAQMRFILRPLLHRCQEIAPTPDQLRKQIQTRLTQISKGIHVGYQVGNLIQLLQELNHDFRGMDFSERWIAQVNFRTNSLHHVTFRGAHFQDCEFAKTFFAITDIAIFPDGESFLTAHFEGKILHWNWQGKILNGFQANNSNVWSIAIHPEGHTFMSLGDDGSIHRWDISTGQETLTLNPAAGCLYSGCFNKKGNLFYSAGEDGIVRVWTCEDCTQLTQWNAHEQRIWAIDINPDGTQLATVSDDRWVAIWDVSSQTKLQGFKGHEDWLRAVAFHPTQSILATGGCDQTICLWDLNTGTLIRSIKPHTEAIFHLEFTPQGDELISGSGDRTIAISDATTGDFIRRIQGHHSSVYACAVDAKGQIASGGDDAQLRIWDSDSGQLHRLIETHLDGISGMVNLANGEEIAFCSVDGLVHVLNLQTWTTTEVWKSPCRLYDIAISRDGQRLALGSASIQVHLLSGQDGSYQNSYSTHASNVPAVAFHPTQSLLASGSWDHSIHIHDLVTGNVIQTFSDHYIQSLDFCPNGNRLAVGGFDCVVKLWDWENAECLQQFVGHQQWVWFVSFSPDGQRLATASADGTCRLWDVKTGDCCHILQGHQDWIMRPVFSPDSQTLLTPSKDQTIRCWSVQTGDCLKVLPDHHSWVGSVLYRPDGQTFLSGSAALTLKQWDANTFQCLKTWEGDRLYGDMDLTHTSGLTSQQRAMMQSLGARQDE